MGKTKKKALKITLAIVIILTVGGFFVNWFLTYRLEKLLRDELSQRVYDATDGFYQLGFDKLSVGLFSGELTIDGIAFRPDSTVFNKWASQDSLPPTYFDVSIGMIHFKGLNLTWRTNYKELNFGLFEIKNSVINIVESNSTKRVVGVSKNTESKTPYDIISTYINVLTVREINLEKANISYFTQYEDNPSLYALKNVDFHAYNFRLDESSFRSGRLLYSEDFDFNAKEPQILLANNQFTLNADAIRLSTKDSLIKIIDIGLIPQKMLWAQTNQYPDSYLEAGVDSVVVRGVNFKRKNAENFLDASSFEIMTSNILYYDTKEDSIVISSKRKKRLIPKETVGLKWSLYTLISPIFKSISIDNIGVKDAKLAYTIKSKEGTDYYKMDKFNFDAYNFKIDSLADIQRKFLYSEGFEVNALNIDATIVSKNYILNVAKMSLSTIKGDFDIKTVNLWPVSKNTGLDYIQGSIDSLSIAGVEYDKGLKVKAFDLEAPVLEYVKMPSKVIHRVRAEKIDTLFQSTLPSNLVAPFISFLSIENIRINNGNLTFRDKQNPKDEIVYKLPNVDFRAKNVYVDEHTIKKSQTFVNYDDFSFEFTNFDNLLPGKEYRLSINRGYYTGSGGNLSLDNIKLIPQINHLKKAPSIYAFLSIPKLQVKGLSYGDRRNVDILKAKSINIQNPQLRITHTSENKSEKKQAVAKNPFNFRIDLGLLNINKANVDYRNIQNKDSLNLTIDKLDLKSIIWNSGEKLLVDQVVVQSPNIQSERHIENNQQTSRIKDLNEPKNIDLLGEILRVNKVEFRDSKMKINRPDLNIEGTINSISIAGIDKSTQLFNITDLNIVKPELKINQSINSDKIHPHLSDSGRSENLYLSLCAFAKKIAINRFAIAGAEIDYQSSFNGKPRKKQQINTTNFNFVGLTIDAEQQKFNLDDFNLTIKNFNFPLDNGFYTLRIGEIDIHKKNQMLQLNKIHLIPAYSKEEFAYHHPKNSDWFDVSVGSVSLAGIDYPTYFADKILNIKDVKVADVKLLNYKTQDIDIEHHAMPMIYSGLQKAPVKMNFQNVEVANFMVKYEELPKGATQAGEIFFTDMNGKFGGFTNIVSRPQQYIKLTADGKLMGTGSFDAVWYIPVDSLNDRFLLTGKLGHFNLKDLNPLITPMAPIEIQDGEVESLVFKTEASSVGARVQMRFLYNDLNVSVLKNSDNGLVANKLYSTLANAVLRKNNPNKEKGKPREPNLYVVRDPDHSTFNYIWQILQPPVVESVGISQGKQNFMKGIGRFILKVKNLFKHYKSELEYDEEEFEK